MNRKLIRGAVFLTTLALVAPLVTAQAPTASSSFSKEQLEQMVAPIALYPDNLVTAVLMAATYPLEVVEADRWLEKNKDLKCAALDTALKDQQWDPAIKSIVMVPEVLGRMSGNLDWMRDLGDAFLGQITEVMDAVQACWSAERFGGTPTGVGAAATSTSTATSTRTTGSTTTGRTTPTRTGATMPSTARV